MNALFYHALVEPKTCDSCPKNWTSGSGRPVQRQRVRPSPPDGSKAADGGGRGHGALLQGEEGDEDVPGAPRAAICAVQLAGERRARPNHLCGATQRASVPSILDHLPLAGALAGFFHGPVYQSL